MLTDHITQTLTTERIVLVNATADILRELLKSDEALAEYLNISIPDQWTEFGQDPFLYTLDKIEKSSHPEWWSWLPVLISKNKLIGNCGYKGPPKKGVVEIGYEIAKDYRRQGYATEITNALIKNAFVTDTVDEVIAHTLAEDNASVKILRNRGFTFAEEINDPEDGQIWKWVLPRPKQRFDN